MKSKYSFCYYFYLFFPIVLWTLCLCIDVDESDAPISLNIASFIVIYMLFYFPYRNDFKQVTIARDTITFKYLFGTEKILHFNKYDGFINAKVKHRGGYTNYIYLVRDHWKEDDAINLDFYKNDTEILDSINKHLRCLGEKDVNPFTHFLFGGGPIDYNKLKKRNNEN